MSLPVTGTVAATAPVRWLYGLWEYYQEYTHTAVHAATAAALTAFGLLVFVDPLFVVLAVASYVCPPLILYSIGSDVGRPSGSSTVTDSTAASVTNAGTGDGDSNRDGADSDSTDGDSDADGDVGDTDSDSDVGDSDSDGTDIDTDSDG